MAKFCPHCGVAVPEDSMFCQNCGSNLSSSGGDVTHGQNNRNNHNSGAGNTNRTVKILNIVLAVLAVIQLIIILFFSPGWLVSIDGVGDKASVFSTAERESR